MIVAEQKPIEEILGMVEGYEGLLLVGCNTCTTVCFAGGEKEVALLGSALRLAAKGSGKTLQTRELVLQRQCEREFLGALREHIDACDAVLSLGCGAGVQLLAETFAQKTVLPALNTKFIGVTEKVGIWAEKCAACGNCILHLTAGICPIARCPKSILNGPCGGSQEGRCEVDSEQDCAWHLIYERLAQRGARERFEEIMPLRDWASSSHGGVRKLVREDLLVEDGGA